MTERDLFAAEYVLRLLEGEELMEARRLAASDPTFAAEVAAWEEILAPLFDDIPDGLPAADAWQRIIRLLDGATDRTVVILRGKLARWRVGAVAASAAAAVLLLLQLAPAPRAPVPSPAQPTRPAPLLVASLAGADGPEILTVAFRPDTSELVVTPARIVASEGRVCEIWLIPSGEPPISLGLLEPDGVQRREVPTSVARQFGPGATIAVSDEPEGGSPTGQPTGAVLATGRLESV